MKLPPKEIKVPSKKVVDLPTSVPRVSDTNESDNKAKKSEPEVTTTSTALVTQRGDSRAGKVIRQFLGDAEIGRGNNDRVFIQFDLNGNPMHFKVGSQKANMFLQQQAYKEGILLTEKNLKEINQTIKAYATMEMKPVAVYLRVAPLENGVEIDLGDDDNTRVRITPGNVELLDKDSNTLFYRTHLTLPMARPGQKGDLIGLNKYLKNIEGRLQVLLIAWITYTMAHAKVDSTNFVHLVVLGPQGAGKSFFCRLLGRLIDPNVVNLQALPRNPKDFMVAAQSCHILFYDNIRAISKPIADLMCGAATGTASSSKQLYTDDGQHVMFLHAPIALNGIYDFVTESDLVQRSLIINLQQMDEKERVSEKVLLAELQADLPEIMMGLFQLIADILEALPQAEVTHPERMIDYCQWLAALEIVDQHEPGTYQELYSETLKAAQLRSLLENDFASEVYKFAISLDRPWKGTPTELFRELSEVTTINTSRRDSDWPRSVESMGWRLKTLIPLLNTQGIFISRWRSVDRYIEITNEQIEGQF